MLRCNAGAIKKTHELMLAGISKHLIGELGFIVQGNYDKGHKWDDPRSAFEGTLVFQLRSELGVYAKHSKRPNTPVVQVNVGREVDALTSWMSWQEKWHKKAVDKVFVLKDASFTFYWGRVAAVDRILFRAEWPDEETGCEQAAHPHMQFDLEGADVSISDMHFPMSGWRIGPDGVSPGCWRFFPKNGDELLQWAVRTVDYMRLQLTDYPPRVLLRPTGDRL